MPRSQVVVDILAKFVNEISTDPSLPSDVIDQIRIAVEEDTIGDTSTIEMIATLCQEDEEINAED